MLAFFRKLRAFLRRDALATDLEDEMRLHIELRAAKLEAAGMSPEEARYAARRRFGNTSIVEERSGDMWGFAAFERLKQDLRFAMRRVRMNPAFSLPIIAVLALGIGATTAVFSAIDAAFLRPLPFARPHELVVLPNVNVPFQEEEDEPGDGMLGITDIAALPSLFAHVAAFASGGLNLSDPDNPVRVNAGVVSADFFGTLGTAPFLGRTFSPAEGKPGANLVTVLSHGLWQRHYGGGDVLGRRIVLHGKSYEIIGVMPRRFSFPNESDLWIPMSVPTTRATFEPFRGWLPSRIVARLAPGVTPQVASAELLARWEQRLADSPNKGRTSLRNRVEDVRANGAAIEMQRKLVGERQRPLAILMGATMLLLLIACANVANLMLSDSARRRREIAVRQVLGATRPRVARQLLAECVTLSLAGAVLGVALAPIALSVLRIMLPEDLAGVADAQLDLRVLFFATLLAVLTGVAFGLWPAVGATRADASHTIKTGGGHGSTTGASVGARRVLVVAELALTVMLLVGAGLMIRSFDRLMSQDFGMDPRHVVTLEMSFSRSAQSRAERLRIVSGTMEHLTQQPGIEAVGAVNDLPLRGGGGLSALVEVPDPPASNGRKGSPFVRSLVASGGYFRALGIDLLRGRTFTPADDSLAPKVAIISNAMARRFWNGTDAVGRRFTLPPDTAPITVIGIVADVRESRADADAEAQAYFSIHAEQLQNVAIVARSTLPPSAMMQRLREAVRSTEPHQAVFNVRTMEDVMGTAVAPRRTNTLLITIFAALALVLAALGVYAVVAYGVAQRAREFGIRSALGASGGSLLGLVSREMGFTLVAGLATGYVGAWTLSRVLASQVYGVDVHDPLTFLTVPLVMLLPAAVATFIPASRASRANPTEVMRAD